MTDKKRMQLHVSGINMLNDCGIRFQFRYIDGIRNKPNRAQIRGTATDRSVSADLTHKMHEDELLPNDVIKDIARDAVAEEFERQGEVELMGDEVGRGIKLVMGDTKDAAVRLSSLHHGDVAPAILPSHISRKFSINMDAFLRDRAKTLYSEAELVRDSYNRKVRESQARALNAIAKKGIDFAGEIDIQEIRLDGDLYESKPLKEIFVIRDTKTSSKSPSRDAATNTYAAVEQSEQLTGYSLAMKVLDGRLPDAVRLDYLVDSKTPKSMIISSTRTQQDVDQFLTRFSNAVHAIHSGVFVPTKPDDWRCSEKWCGYFSICPYARRPKSAAVTAPKQLVQIELTHKKENTDAISSNEDSTSSLFVKEATTTDNPVID